MPQLPDASDNKTSSAFATVRRYARERRRRASKAVLKSHRMQPVRGREFPIRIRPVCITHYPHKSTILESQKCLGSAM